MLTSNSVPIICANRLVSFYVDTESIQFMSLQQSQKTITAAIEKIKSQQVSEEDDNPFIQSLFMGRRQVHSSGMQIKCLIIFFRKPQIAPEENVMVTYEYQYDYTEVDGEETGADFPDYGSRGSKKTPKAEKTASKSPKNKYLFLLNFNERKLDLK